MIGRRDLREVAKCLLLVLAVTVLAVLTKNCDGPRKGAAPFQINIEGDTTIMVDAAGKVVGHDTGKVPGP